MIDHGTGIKEWNRIADIATDRVETLRLEERGWGPRRALMFREMMRGEEELGDWECPKYCRDCEAPCRSAVDIERDPEHKEVAR